MERLILLHIEYYQNKEEAKKNEIKVEEVKVEEIKVEEKEDNFFQLKT